MICQLCKNKTNHVTGVVKDKKQIWVCLLCKDKLIEIQQLKIEATQ